MPARSNRVCKRCRQSVAPGPCPNCRPQQQREWSAPSERARPSAAKRGYDRKWRAAAAEYLESHPYCECDTCTKQPLHRRALATDVNHRDGLGPLGPRGYDPTNWQAMAHGHHSRTTVTEHGGFGRTRRTD